MDNQTNPIITRSGARIDPARIEAALRNDPLVAHAAVFGTGHSFLTALLVLDPAVAEEWAAEQGRPAAPLAQLAHDDELIRAIALSIAFANRDLAPIERVKAFTVVGEEWLPGSTLLSSSGEPQREAIAERYAADLQAMFDNDPYSPPPAGDAPADPTLPPFVTSGAAQAPRPAPPVAPPDSVPASGAPLPADPTPSYSAVLRPARPLGQKDPAARTAGTPSTSDPSAMQFDSSSDDVWEAAHERSDDLGTPAGDGGGEPPVDESLDWDATWPPERRPARRWWWAVLLALVIVAAGAVVVKTMSNDSGSGDEFTVDTMVDQTVDTSPDTAFENPDSVDSVADTTVAPAVSDSLIQTIAKVPNLTTFLSVVKAVGLDVDLNGTQQITVLAPTDDAFNKLPSEVLDALLANKELLAKILRHHLINGTVYAENLTDGDVTARDGSNILVGTAGDITFDRTVKPVDTDIPASNGVLHTIDSVLIPPGTDLTTLVPTTTTLPPKLFFSVYFEKSPRKITSDGKTVIAEAAEAIKALPADSEVVVTGYSQNYGTAGKQRYYAKLRANSTIAALRKAGATNVRYKVVLVIRLPRSGSKTEARRAEITLPGYVDPATTSTTTGSSVTTTTMKP